MSFSDADETFMRAALAEARVAAKSGEVPVGAVVVRNNDIVGRGLNRPIQDCDPTSHAEIIAIRDAAKATGNYRLAGCTLYVTLEPCTMCMGALIQARVTRLVFAAYDEKAGAAGSVVDLASDRRLNHHLEVNGGLQAPRAEALLKAFFESRRDRATRGER